MDQALSALLQYGALGVLTAIFVGLAIQDKRRTDKKLEEVTNKLLGIGAEQARLVEQNTSSNEKLAKAIDRQTEHLQTRPCLLPPDPRKVQH